MWYCNRCKREQSRVNEHTVRRVAGVRMVTHSCQCGHSTASWTDNPPPKVSAHQPRQLPTERPRPRRNWMRDDN